MDTMVCAGVEGGGTNSCEVRAGREPPKEGKGRETGLGVGTGGRVLLAVAREDAEDRFEEGRKKGP